jgi:hypothetical protein
MSQDQKPGSRKWNLLTEEIVEQKIRENGGPIHLQIPPVTHVDLNTGATSLIDPLSRTEGDSDCLSAWMNAQTEFVPLPVIGGRSAEGFQMTGRVVGSHDDDGYPTPGANMLIFESPSGAVAMAVGFARREPDGADLWGILLKNAEMNADRLKRPPVPWVARHSSALNGVRAMPRVLPEIEVVEKTMVLSLLRYYALIDYINTDR